MHLTGRPTDLIRTSFPEAGFLELSRTNILGRMLLAMGGCPGTVSSIPEIHPQDTSTTSQPQVVPRHCQGGKISRIRTTAPIFSYFWKSHRTSLQLLAPESSHTILEVLPEPIEQREWYKTFTTFSGSIAL